MEKMKKELKNKDYIIFGLSGSKELAKKVSEISNIEFCDENMKHFNNGETYFNIKKTIRGKKVFVIQSTSTPVNERMMELLIFLDTLRRISVDEINVVIPFFGYARQDRKSNGREPITAALVAKLIEKAGADRVISFDFHSSQIQGFFDIPIDELKSVGIIYKEIEKLDLKDMLVVSPDHGGVRRARSLAKLINSPIAVIDKRRGIDGKIEQVNLLGDVNKKNCIIIDDMIDSGSTILNASNLIVKNGAKSVIVATTHSVFFGNEKNKFLDKLDENKIDKFITTNSIEMNDYYKKNYKNKIIIADLSESIAGFINAHINKESITDFFINKYYKK